MSLGDFHLLFSFFPSFFFVLFPPSIYQLFFVMVEDLSETTQLILLIACKYARKLLTQICVCLTFYFTFLNVYLLTVKDGVIICLSSYLHIVYAIQFQSFNALDYLDPYKW